MAKSEYTVEQTALYYQMKLARLREDMIETDYRRRLRDVVMLESAAEFLRRIADRDTGIFAKED